MYGQHEDPFVLMLGRLAEFLLVVTVAFQGVHPHPVDRLDQVVPEVFVSGFGQQGFLGIKRAGLVAGLGQIGHLYEGSLPVILANVTELGNDTRRQYRSHSGGGIGGLRYRGESTFDDPIRFFDLSLDKRTLSKVMASVARLHPASGDEADTMFRRQGYRTAGTKPGHPLEEVVL